MEIKRPPLSSITIKPPRRSPCTFPPVPTCWSGSGKVSPRTRLFALHHPVVFYYFCCPGCHRNTNTPSSIDFSLIGYGGPCRGGTICCAELLKHLGSSLQPSGEILLSNLGLISKIRSRVKLLYIHSACFTPGGVGSMFTLLLHSLRTSSVFFFTCNTKEVPLGNTLPPSSSNIEGQGGTMYYMLTIIPHCRLDAQATGLWRLTKAVKMSRLRPSPVAVAFHVPM